jgi:hypothetical protein
MTAWFAKAVEAIYNCCPKLSDWAGRHPDSAKTLIYILGALLLVLVAPYRLYRNPRIPFTPATQYKRGFQGSSLPALEGVADNWNDAFALARQALHAGDLYRTMWITHRILLSVLDLREVVRFARWKTNSDYIRECKSNDTAAATLRNITRPTTRRLRSRRFRS